MAHGEAEAEGFRYFWMVNRDSRRVYLASVFVRGPHGRPEITIGKELAERPASKEDAKRACNELVPQLVKVSRNRLD